MTALNKNWFLILGVLFMFVCGLQLAEPTAAATYPKVIDKGTQKVGDSITYYKAVQYNKWKIVRTERTYIDGKLALKSRYTLIKITHKKLRFVEEDWYKKKGKWKHSKNTQYIKTTKVVRDCYTMLFNQ